MALDLMVQNLLETQELRKEHLAHCDGLNRLHEFCTIKFGGPRQMGHTETSIKVAKRYFKDVIYMAHNVAMCENVKERVGEDGVKFFSTGQIESMRGTHADCVIVDTSFFVSPTKMEDLEMVACGLFAGSEKKCLILLQ